MKALLRKPSLAGLLFLFCFDSIFAETKTAAVANSPVVIAQVLIGLAVVTALILVFAWLAKRIGYGGFIPQKNMRVISYMMLSHREKAVLVQVGNTQMLLGVAPGRVSLLHTFEHPVVETETDTAHGGVGSQQKVSDFSRYLKDILKSGSSER